MTEYACSENILPGAYGLEMETAGAQQQSLLSTRQQLALMSLVRVADPVARQQVIAHNLRLVVNIAKRYSDRGVALLDLVREGVQGLVHALESFELEGGFRFSAYAARCVRLSIEHAVVNRNNQRCFDDFRPAPSMAPDVSFEQFA